MGKLSAKPTDGVAAAPLAGVALPAPYAAVEIVSRMRLVGAKPVVAGAGRS